MPNTILVNRDLTTATVALGENKGLAGTIEHEVHDGDTIKVRGDNFGVRFLGIDTPEISLEFPYPKAKKDPKEKRPLFPPLTDPIWEDFLGAPFDDKWGPIKLDPALQAHLASRIKRAPGAAINQFRWATKARDFLLNEVQTDMEELKQTEATFRFFLLFANEITDRYGRFLSYIRPDQPELKKLRAGLKTNAEKAKHPYKTTYNQRLVDGGWARPYFIWPNLDPFRVKPLAQAAMPPGALQRLTRDELKDTRDAVRTARAKGTGCYAPKDGLKLEPFELRFLARRQPPSRWVIDLSKDDNKLIPPHEYYTVPNLEDRLFVDEDYLPLFTTRGWVPRASAAPVVAPPVRSSTHRGPVSRGGRVKAP